jgi:hypothetical protein
MKQLARQPGSLLRDRTRRCLRWTPALTATAIAPLAIGFGGAAAVFTAVGRVLLAPLP